MQRGGDDDGEDVPSPIDFHDPVQAHEWVESTIRKRPWRPRFFDSFCAALTAQDAHELPEAAVSGAELRVLELGSGPGHLAREIVVRCRVREYVALDFSAAMHDLARAHLGEHAPRVTFVERDFREPAWGVSLRDFDAVVTLQAAHETRHKRHLVPLLARARETLRPGGLLLYCDHYLTGESKRPALVVERDEQPRAIERAGFREVARVLDEGGMALYAARAL